MLGVIVNYERFINNYILTINNLTNNLNNKIMNVTISMPKGATSIINVSKNNPESAGLMLRANSTGVNDQGFMQEEKRVAWFKGKTEQIEAFVEQYDLKEGSIFPLPVRLVIKESNTPFYAGQEPKVNPTTGEVIKSNGLPVYRNTIVVAESSSEQDSKLATDREAVNVTAQATISDFHTETR